MRLNKFLAHHGFASRRAADELIQNGKVLVNGEKATLGQQVEETDVVTVRGKNVGTLPPLVYYLVHKPTGVVSTARDPEGRQTVLNLVPASGRLYPVGRLDYDSEGLVLLTNDGALAYRLTHPKFEVEKVYKVLVKGKPGKETLAKFEKGVMVEGQRAAATKIQVLESQAEDTWIELTIHEGRNRQIRKMCHTVGHPVVRLIRLKLGPYELSSLKPGEYKQISKS